MNNLYPTSKEARENQRKAIMRATENSKHVKEKENKVNEINKKNILFVLKS